MVTWKWPQESMGTSSGAENPESQIPAPALPVTFLVVLVSQGSPQVGQEMPRMACRQALEKEDSPARVSTSYRT